MFHPQDHDNIDFHSLSSLHSHLSDDCDDDGDDNEMDEDIELGHHSDQDDDISPATPLAIAMKNPFFAALTTQQRNQFASRHFNADNVVSSPVTSSNTFPQTPKQQLKPRLRAQYRKVLFVHTDQQSTAPTVDSQFDPTIDSHDKNTTATDETSNPPLFFNKYNKLLASLDSGEMVFDVETHPAVVALRSVRADLSIQLDQAQEQLIHTTNQVFSHQQQQQQQQKCIPPTPAFLSPSHLGDFQLENPPHPHPFNPFLEQLQPSSPILTAGEGPQQQTLAAAQSPPISNVPSPQHILETEQSLPLDDTLEQFAAHFTPDLSAILSPLPSQLLSNFILALLSRVLYSDPDLFFFGIDTAPEQPSVSTPESTPMSSANTHQRQPQPSSRSSTLFRSATSSSAAAAGTATADPVASPLHIAPSSTSNRKTMSAIQRAINRRLELTQLLLHPPSNRRSISRLLIMLTQTMKQIDLCWGRLEILLNKREQLFSCISDCEETCAWLLDDTAGTN